MGPFGAAEARYLAHLALARAQIATGRAGEARIYLAGQLARAQAHGLTNREIELSLLDALAAQALGDETGSRPRSSALWPLAGPEGTCASSIRIPA